jgi:poly-beta-1,6-N-acetyl-D-glucosamine synthase
MPEILTISLIIFTSSYFILIFLFIWGWKKNFPINQFSINPSTLFLSVVIAIRDEEKNLPALLNNLVLQKYPSEFYEVVFSDDGSTDNSLAIINKFISDNKLKNFYCISPSKTSNSGKKEAIKRAIEFAHGSIIIASDADCRSTEDWLKTIAHVFHHSEYQMVIGPVIIDTTDDQFFTKLQALEFMSLTGSTGGAANIGLPIMCNGANLAFRKEAWKECEPAAQGKELSSGDDIFLLHSFSQKYPGKILFLKDPKAIVLTQPSGSIRAFFSQRSRWAGKSTSYSDAFTIFTGLIVAGLNVIMGILFLLALVKSHFIYPLLISFSIKMMVDSVLLLHVSGFTKQRTLLWLFPLVSILYPFYVTTTIFLAIFTNQSWKSRKI